MAETNPYAFMSDEQVLKRAIAAHNKERDSAPGSIQRIIAAAVFDNAMMELDRRMIRHVLTKLGRAPRE